MVEKITKSKITKYMKTKSKLILLALMALILIIDWYVILPKFLFLLGWFLLGAFAFVGPIIGAFFLIRSFFVKAP